MYSDEQIRSCFYKMMQLKAEKQKDVIDRKSSACKAELEQRGERFKRKIQQDAMNQIAIIERNTEAFKRQVEAEAKIQKQMIDENLKEKEEAGLLTLEDVKSILCMLSRNY